MYNRRIMMMLLMEIFLIILSITVTFFLITRERNLYAIKKQKNIILQSAQTETRNLSFIEMTQEQIDDLASKGIEEQTEEEIEFEATEQNVDDIYDEMITPRSIPSVDLGSYVGLTYYSQIDSRWRNYSYTSVGNNSQTIGTSGCGPAVAAMVVTATKGTIIPPEMGDLFVMYGYRSANSGTYWSAFNFVANTFGIDYSETADFNQAIDLLRNNYYVIVSCGNGLFSNGGHFVLLTGIKDNIISVYDPYLYTGKFDISSRKGKVTLEGNTVYVSVDNLKNYANYRRFFAYNKGDISDDNQDDTSSEETYIRYVSSPIGLNVRYTPNGEKIDAIPYRTRVTVYETKDGWSRIGTNRWVDSRYLSAEQPGEITSSYTLGNYRVTANVLRVRTGPGTNYSAKNYNQLTANARRQNRELGNYYTNGYRRGVVCTVNRIDGNWGRTPSGWVCLDYCVKI